ncbi:MAG TPA: hypothetical protein VHG08_05025 [Longimicrobium sp.]|nr:hypothetical protein [Longimicrobium sp.]
MAISRFGAARAAALLCLAAAAACAADGNGPTLNTAEHPSGTLFFSQVEPPHTYMQALFEGRVYRDAAGCLRLEMYGVNPHGTAIWPYGFTMEDRDGELHVKDARGRSIGRVGGHFRFGGGEKDSVKWLGISERQQELARTRCPGKYWIVGETDLGS